MVAATTTTTTTAEENGNPAPEAHCTRTTGALIQLRVARVAANFEIQFENPVSGQRFVGKQSAYRYCAMALFARLLPVIQQQHDSLRSCKTNQGLRLIFMESYCNLLE